MSPYPPDTLFSLPIWSPLGQTPSLRPEAAFFKGKSSANAFGSGQSRELRPDRLAHNRRSDARLARPGDVPGPEAAGENGGDGAIESVGPFAEFERVPQCHPEGCDHRDRIGDALAGDVGRRAVDRLVERLTAAALRIGGTE